MEDKEKVISITEEQLKIIEDEFCLIKFENKAELLESFLYDYLNYKEERKLIELVKEIVLDGKDYMKELLERDDIYILNVDDHELYVHCSEADLNEAIREYQKIDIVQKM